MWLVIGLILGIVLVALVFWLRSRKIRVAWYEWLLGVLGLLSMVFSLQNYQASVAAFESTAPGMFLLVFGLPGLILVLLAVALALWRYSRSTRLARIKTDGEKQSMPQA